MQLILTFVIFRKQINNLPKTAPSLPSYSYYLLESSPSSIFILSPMTAIALFIRAHSLPQTVEVQYYSSMHNEWFIDEWKCVLNMHRSRKWTQENSQ